MITTDQVVAFKTRYCDENALIADLLRARLPPRLAEPIVDVGAGLGDIARAAFPDRKVVLLDILSYSDESLDAKHRRVESDFFEFVGDCGTLLFCHALQFLDEDRSRLEAKCLELCPVQIVTVMNDNDGFMGELVGWATRNIKGANPEVHLPGFPVGFTPIDQVTFSATLRCPDFAILEEQVSYLLDVRDDSTGGADLGAFLQHQLSWPEFPINQRITLYGSNDRQSRPTV